MAFECAILDIGHGDSIVVTFTEGRQRRCIVVDGGQTRDAARRLATFLKARGVSVIDLLVVTHTHADHIGGIIQLLRNESKKRDGWNGGAERCLRSYWGPLPGEGAPPARRAPQSMERPVTLSARSYVMESVAENRELQVLLRERLLAGGKMLFPSLQDQPPIPFKSIRLELLGPLMQVPDSRLESVALSARPAVMGGERPRTRAAFEGFVATRAEEAARMANENANNQSIVLRVTPKLSSGRLSKWSFLLPGDAEEEAWQSMRGNDDVKRRLKAKVLKLPHHGSALNGIDGESFRLVDPTHCVNSSGQKHGLPDAPTLNLVRGSESVELFCTERNNSNTDHGPCRAKDRCPRRTTARYKSVRFTVNTKSDTCEIKPFDIDVVSGAVRDVEDDIIWCPERSWAEGA